MSDNTPAAKINRSRLENLAQGNTGGPLAFPSTRPAYGTNFRFRKYEYVIDGTKSNITTTISNPHLFLPLPTQLQENLALGYSVSDIGLAGRLFAAGAGAGTAAGNLLTGKNNVEGVKNALGDGAGATNAAAFIARSIVGELSKETGQAINLQQGNVPNPYTIASFERVEVRTHNLTFKLVPSSEQESRTIRNIIDMFRMKSLPSKEGMFLTMPEEVEVEFFGTDFLFAFAPCVIRNISVNYAPQGPAPFFAGSKAPTAVELNILLSEIEPLTRQSYLGTAGGAVPDTANAGV